DEAASENNTNDDQSDDSQQENDDQSDDSDDDSNNQESNASNEQDDDSDDTPAEVNDDADEADDDVTSSIVDSATGVRIVSESDELNGKSIVVTAMNPSGSINADHDLYDIHVLNADGTLYSLNNPVTVYLPANGFVSNVY